jgi:hypothetical protein
LLIIYEALSNNQIKRSSTKLTYTPKPKDIRYCNYTTASIELELLPISSSEVWLLDSLAEISIRSITRGSWLGTHTIEGLQIWEAKASAINFVYIGNWNDFSGLGRKLGFAKKGKWRGGLNIVLQEKNIVDKKLERMKQEWDKQ